jgi:predicted porin
MKMKKKAVVVAVGLALAAPLAWGQEEEPAGDAIVLYGKLYPELNTARGKDPTPAGASVATLTSVAPTGVSGIVNRMELNGSNTNFGVRGSEGLGAGLRAIFQMETEFRVDQNTTAFAARDSFVGLRKDSWGTIRLGRMDTPFKKWGDTLQFLGVSSGNIVSSSNVLRTVGFGNNSAATFHLRRVNAVDYVSPRVGGFQAAAQYSTDEADTATRHPHVWSGGIRYDNGPIYVALNHERHWDLFGGSRNAPTAMSNFTDQNVRSKDQATQLDIELRMGKHKVEFDYIRKEYKENPTITGRFQDYKNNAYMVVLDSRWNSQWRTMAHYIKSDRGSCTRVLAGCITDGLDGSQTSIGAAYYFSRRTYLFAFVQWIKNGRSAIFNSHPTQAPAVGEDLLQYALGLATTF